MSQGVEVKLTDFRTELQDGRLPSFFLLSFLFLASLARAFGDVDQRTVDLRSVLSAEGRFPSRPRRSHIAKTQRPDQAQVPQTELRECPKVQIHWKHKKKQVQFTTDIGVPPERKVGQEKRCQAHWPAPTYPAFFINRTRKYLDACASPRLYSAFCFDCGSFN